MKKVMTRDTREVILIDPIKEPNWMFDYLHCWGFPFSDPVRETTSAQQNEDIESLRALYEKKYDREVPVNKKNDAEWIQSKL